MNFISQNKLLIECVNQQIRVLGSKQQFCFHLLSQRFIYKKKLPREAQLYQLKWYIGDSLIQGTANCSFGKLRDERTRQQFPKFPLIHKSQLARIKILKAILRGQQAGRLRISKGRKQAASVFFFFFLISLLSGGKKQIVSDFFFSSLCKIKRRQLLKFCVAMWTPGST